MPPSPSRHLTKQEQRERIRMIRISLEEAGLLTKKETNGSSTL